jgi:hypothetical protein
MKINKLISSIIAGSALLAAGTVNAALIDGNIVQISTNLAGNTITFWVKPASFGAIPAFVYSVTTNNLIIGASLGSALNRSVRLNTSAACGAAVAGVRSCGSIINIVFIN